MPCKNTYDILNQGINSDWEPDKKFQMVDGFFKKISPTETLYYYDGPMIFTFLNEGKMYLACVCDMSDTYTRYIAAHTDDSIISMLKDCELSVREAFLLPNIYCFDVNSSNEVECCWEIPSSILPDNMLPKVGVMLKC